MKDGKKFKDEKTISKEFSAKISNKEESVIIENFEVEKIKEVEKVSFYYILRSDYKDYKKGDIVCNKEDIEKFTEQDLNKVIIVKNK